jgi:Fur family transcriptional regulator, ferric uptake regulator
MAHGGPRRRGSGPDPDRGASGSDPDARDGHLAPATTIPLGRTIPEGGQVHAAADSVVAWEVVRERLRDRGLRWTPQRRILIDVLSRTGGHITGAELVERCREIDASTIPSTVYRTLDVLEELGLVRHCHGADGREEFHVLPAVEHGHLFCAECGSTLAIEASDAAALVAAIEAAHGFEVDLSHVTIVGSCRACRGS